MDSPTFLAALERAGRLNDAELIQLRREVSRLARAAYGRSPRYQQSYAIGMQASKSKTDAARRNSSPGISSGAAIRDATSEGQ